MSATHSWFGRSAVNRRSTRSRRVSGCPVGRVVRGLRPRRTPWRPAILIRWATWSRPICQPARSMAWYVFRTPVDAVVLLVDPFDLRQQDLISHRPWRSGAGLGGEVTAGGDEPTRSRTQSTAGWLDPETVTVFVDEPDHLVVGRSSSLAKKAEAALRISLARRASASSRLRRLFCSSKDSATGVGATSGTYRSHHNRKASSPTPTPICAAISPDRARTRTSLGRLTFKNQSDRAPTQLRGCTSWACSNSPSAGSEPNPGRFALIHGRC